MDLDKILVISLTLNFFIGYALMNFIHRQIQFIIYLFLVFFVADKFEILWQKIINMTKPKLGNYKIGDFQRNGHSDVELHMEFNCGGFFFIALFINYEMYLYETNTIKRSYHHYVTKKDFVQY